jgi:hypothetical protein
VIASKIPNAERSQSRIKGARLLQRTLGGLRSSRPALATEKVEHE